MELRVYSAAEVHAALPWLRLAQALREAFVEATTQAPVRHAHDVGQGGSLLLMPAWSPNALGVKIVTVMPQAAQHGAGTVQASYLLMDRHTGVPRALIDGEALTLRRTAAASALAAQRLARGDSRQLLLVGAGRLAPWMARAHLALNPHLQSVQVWARRAEAAQACARELQSDGLAAQAVTDLRTAVAQADVVCCVTTSTAPLVEGAWLKPGTHLDLVGGFRRTMREADDTAVQRAHVVVDTYAGALAEAGDLTQPMDAGLIGREHIRAELAELLRGLGERPNAEAITLFKSVGTAIEDLAAARLLVEPHI
jgi:ornithine cyclodeaminase/alanine dehydrogenase-like protein (mu-crystallin family)